LLRHLPSPMDEQTFTRCKLDPAERRRNKEALALHRDLLRLRREDPVLRRAGTVRVDGAVLMPQAFVLRYPGGGDGDRLLIVNLGCDQDVTPMPEPLLAPSEGGHWALLWSSESIRYGGQGTPPLRPHSLLHVPGESAILLASRPGAVDDERDGDGTQ
jgi:maltooligosyltrehalose trehalohydrolase